MGELDANRVKLKEDEDTEEMVGQEEGGEVDRAEQRLLPVNDVKEDRVQVEHGHRALDGREEEDEEREEEEGGLCLVDQGDVEDDQVQVVANHDQLLQQDDHKGINVDNASTEEHGRDSGKAGSDEEEQGDAELGQPDVPGEEQVPQLGLLIVEVGGGEVVEGGAEGDKLQNQIQAHIATCSCSNLCSTLFFVAYPS